MSTEQQSRPEGLLDDLVSDFLDEASQLLDRLNEDLLTLDEWVSSRMPGDTARCDDALMNNMFRSAHSIKGLSAMLGLTNINRLTHCIENVFDGARKGELDLSRHIVQTIFESVDKLSAMVNLLRLEGHDEHDAGAVIVAIQEILQGAGCERKATTQADAERALDPLPAATPPQPAVQTIAIEDPFAGVVDEGQVPARYLSIFIDETEMSLDSLTETLVGSEQADSAAALENLLITSHRIKGSAASVGLHRIAKLAHLMEDILQELRESRGKLSREVADAMLQCTDGLRACVTALKEGVPMADDFQRLATDLLLANASAVHPSETKKSSAPTIVASETASPIETLKQLATKHAHGSSPVQVGYVRFVAGLSLAGLKAQLIYEKVAQVGRLLSCDPPPEGVDELDSLELLLFAVESEVAAKSLQSRLFIAGVSEVQIFPIGDLLGNATPTVVVSQTPPAVASSPANLKKESAEHAPESAAKSKGATDASRPNETLRVDIERLDQLMNLAGQLVINKARFTQIGEGLRESMFSKQTPQRIANAASLTRKLLHEADKTTSSPELEAIRSHARRLQGDLEAVQRELARVGQLRTKINDLFEAVHQLDRVADGIQKSVMDTRMVPIGPLFGRFKRVVRDITRLNSKDIDLVIRGEKTELDKRMIDELGDPLIHMVRNAADHGIESPEARTAAGKPAQGTLTLDAFHRGNSIIIQVVDDGKGLDKDRILAKAIEKKLISPAEAEKMTPQQAYQLIWEPGFSTAEKITEISGRGMGMDIVRSKIEDISGTVEVDSIPGQGTTFTIKLPLTLAILPSLMAEIAGDVFALPVESIIEIVSVPRDDLSTVHGVRTAVIRNRVVSVVELDEIFSWNARESARDDSARGTTRTDCTLVVLGQEGREIGLRVDALLGEEDVVIKSMAENYRNVPGIAGASILGSGRVSLILDVAALIAMSSHEASVVV